jgi:hypothetical protein
MSVGIVNGQVADLFPSKARISFAEKVRSEQRNATQRELDGWIKTPPQPRSVAAIEATILSGWVYYHLLSHAASYRPESKPERRLV